MMKYLTGWEIEFYKDKHNYLQLIEETMQQKQECDVGFLEESLCDLTGRTYAIPCASGTDALEVTLRALGIGPGDEVLVPSFSWISSASVVKLVGAKPVFIEVALSNYHMIPAHMMACITENTKAAICPHLFGSMFDPRVVQELCDTAGIHFIEDACQAIGASYDGIPAGASGTTSCFSFNTNKNIAGFSGGGAVLTDDPEIAVYARKWARHGEGEFLGRNSKMLLLDAKVIDYRLKHIWEWQLRRQTMADVYNTKLEPYPVILQNTDENVDHSYHKYVVMFENQEIRDAVKAKIGGTVHYQKPIYGYEIFKDDRPKLIFPLAKNICDTILSVPFHHFYDPEDVAVQANEIVGVLDQYYG